MKEKSSLILVISIILIVSICGCVEKDEDQNTIYKSSKNLSPNPVIIAPSQAFFGENVEFDASTSYDQDGSIVSYRWDFVDDSTKEGKIVTHNFEILDYDSTEFPVKYLVTLEIADNNESYEYCNHEIFLYPKNYTLYFNKQKLSSIKPVNDKDNIQVSFGLFNFRPLEELTYELENPVSLFKGSWNAKLYINKPTFLLIKKITMTLYNQSGDLMAVENLDFQLIQLWNEKQVSINGNLIKKDDLKSISLSFYGFSFRNKIEINYGGNQASLISFGFILN